MKPALNTEIIYRVLVVRQPGERYYAVEHHSANLKPKGIRVWQPSRT